MPACAAAAQRPPATRPAPVLAPIVRAPLSTLGIRPQTPCPPPTSCLSVARGGATWPSLPMMARTGLREAAPVAEMAALKIGCVCAQRAGHTGTHAEGEHLYLSGRSGRGRCGSANGGARAARIRTKAGLGVRSDHRPKHHKQPRRRGGKPGSGTGSGAIFTEGLYCEAVIREAVGRVGVPKQRLCVSSGVSTYIPLKIPKGILK
jgi:hypothetical protein